jgi:hypothetical protein
MGLAAAGLLWGAVAWAATGDVDGSGDVNVADVQCAILVVLAGDGALPVCSGGAVEPADLDCSGSALVTDVLLVIGVVLDGALPAEFDLDGDGVHDDCEGACLANSECSNGEVCLREIGACDADGVCAPEVPLCDELGGPVCGCDGVTYASACKAFDVGVGVVSMGECAEPGCGGVASDPAFGQGEPGNLGGVTVAHNELRAVVGSAPLTYSVQLAIIPEAFVKNCTFTYNANRTAQWKSISGANGFVSENIFWFKGAEPGGAAATAQWAAGKANYDFASNSCAGAGCAQYTQMVLHQVELIGCAKTLCSTLLIPPSSSMTNAWFVVCDYAVGANQLGVWPYPPTDDPCVDLDGDGVLQQDDCYDLEKAVGVVAGCTPAPLPTDFDGDGVHVPTDCDDGHPGIKPGAIELLDGRDNDCDGFVD